MPQDHGAALIAHVQSNNARLQCVSDASVINGQGRHAWMITSNSPKHITQPEMSISGHGVVGGHPCDMSSGRAELHGQTALAIMLNHLQRIHKIGILPAKFICDNQGILQGCSQVNKHRIQHHRQANMDFYMEFWHQASSLDIQQEWVKGHQDKDVTWHTLQDLSDASLDHSAKLNIICDKIAVESQ